MRLRILLARVFELASLCFPPAGYLFFTFGNWLKLLPGNPFFVVYRLDISQIFERNKPL